MRSPEELTRLFRSEGRKVTAQRQCIFRALQGDLTHPSAEAVHAAVKAHMETISLKTVYQTLHELADMGEIGEIDLGTGTTRFDPNIEGAHHHLVCRSCAKVTDLHADFSELRAAACDVAGFEVATVEVIFRGLCKDCRQRAEATTLRPGSAHAGARSGRVRRREIFDLKNEATQ